MAQVTTRVVTYLPKHDVDISGKARKSSCGLSGQTSPKCAAYIPTRTSSANHSKCMERSFVADDDDDVQMQDPAFKIEPPARTAHTGSSCRLAARILIRSSVSTCEACARARVHTHSLSNNSPQLCTRHCMCEKKRYIFASILTVALKITIFLRS
jgi:hypothetical protein